MTTQTDYKRLIRAAAVPLLTTLACAGLLTSCATAPAGNSANGGFKFWVLRYKPAVDASSWIPDPALSADPEGAAMNIATAMRQGNIQLWLANWESPDRPQLSPAQSAALQQDWQSLRGAHFSILGRVVAEADVIIELSVAGPQNQSGKIQIPLKRSQDRWWLTAIDPSSEYLKWENSPNKLIQYIDPDAFQKHIDMIQGPRSKSKADAAPVKAVPPIAGL